MTGAMIYVSHNRRHHNVGTCLWHVSNALIFCLQRNMPKACPYAMALSFWEIAPCEEIILLSGVFRRETASGFYPWCNVVNPRKRVAEGLCGWRHGNLFPMTQSAQSHRQMRSIPRCFKAVFYVFVFGPFTIRQQCRLYPPDFFTEPKK